MPASKVTNQPNRLMGLFRAEMREARENGVAHPWAGLRMLAQEMFGPRAFSPSKDGGQPRLSLSQHQMERLSAPGPVEENLRNLRATGRLSDGVRIEAATKRFTGAAKEALAGAGVTASTAKQGNLTLMTFNIKHGVKSSLREIAAFIKGMDNPPDLIALEEVDKGQSRSGKVNQAAVLGKMLGMHATFQPACKMNDGEYGVALLSKFPIKSSSRVPLGRFGDHEPRVLLQAEVKVNGERVPVNVTHLTHLGPKEREMQMRKVMNAVTGDSILMGDLNTAPGTRTYKMADKVFHDTWAEGADARSHRIDYIFTGKGFITRNAFIPRGSQGLSDHVPRVSTVKIK
jgi:endonuclease/exonuclease/phosphatase family metal-dependent hydrolase